MPIRPEVLAIIDAMTADDGGESTERMRIHFVNSLAKMRCPLCDGPLFRTEDLPGPACRPCLGIWGDTPDNFLPFTERTVAERQYSIDYWRFIAMSTD